MLDQKPRYLATIIQSDGRVIVRELKRGVSIPLHIAYRVSIPPLSWRPLDHQTSVVRLGDNIAELPDILVVGGGQAQMEECLYIASRLYRGVEMASSGEPTIIQTPVFNLKDKSADIRKDRIISYMVAL